MKEKLAFRYESVGNICKLLASIQFEKIYDPRDVSVFHQRFDSESDDWFYQALCKLYPQGVTVGEEQINKLVGYIHRFMKIDGKCSDLYVEYDKRRFRSYVYFKPDKMVVNASAGSHYDIVVNILKDFFKGCSDIDEEYLKRFIRENFEIESDFTTVEKICADVSFLAQEIFEDF